MAKHLRIVTDATTHNDRHNPFRIPAADILRREAMERHPAGKGRK